MQSSKKTDEKKKVLIVPSWYPSQDDPISGIFIQEQAHALAADYDVAVLIPRMNGWRNLLRSNNSTLVADERGVPVFRASARPLIPHGPEFTSHETFVRAAQKGFKRVLKEWGRPDVIHAHVVLPAGWAALNLAKQYGIPIVLTEHSGPFSMHVGTPLQKRLVKQTLSEVDRVVAVSLALADQIIMVHRQVQLRIVGELVRTDFFIPSYNGVSSIARNNSPLKFLFAGRLSAEKGVTNLITAAQKLVQHGISSFELIIGGDGPDRSSLEALVDSVGLRDRCTFLGVLNREGVRRAMQSCDVFVLPSLSETFGIVLGEAMACGKPVIATRCGGPDSIVTPDTGVLVATDDSEALSNAMADFISERTTFDSSKVRESVVNRFGPGAFLNQVSRIYEELWSKGSEN